MPIRIAVLQTRGTPGDADANLAELARAAGEASGNDADLLVTPEMFVTGYDIGDRLTELARRDLVAPAQDIARTSGIAIVLGGPEATGDRIHNAAYFIGSDGEVRATYRKSHLFGALDRKLFAAGDEPYAMVDLDGVRIAMMICYDVEFPEAVRAAALAGAHLVAVPTAQMTPFSFVAEQVVRVRAWENQVYVAYANHDGDEGSLTYVGRSSIIDPDARVLDSIEHGDGLVYGDVDPELVERRQRDNPYLADRRPEVY